MSISVMQILNELQVNITPGKKGECPKCGHRTFALRRDRTVAKCFHPSCGFFITRKSSAATFENLLHDALRTVLDEFRTALAGPVGQAAREYILKTRKVHPQVMADCLIGAVPEHYDPGLAFKPVLARAEKQIGYLEQKNAPKPECDGAVRVLNNLREALAALKNLLRAGQIAFFYTDEEHKLRSIRFRKPNAKDITCFKPTSRLGAFGHGLFPVHDGKGKVDEEVSEQLMVMEGEFDFLQLQSMCVREGVQRDREPETNYVYALATGGSSTFDLGTLTALSSKPILIYDNDDAGRGMLRKIRNTLTVEAFTVPDGFKDLDEFVCSFGEKPVAAYAAFKKLLARRVAYGLEASEAPDDPHRLARIFHENSSHTDGWPTVISHRDEVMVWDNARYFSVSKNEIKSLICNCVKEEMDRIAVEERRDAAAQGRETDRIKSRKVTNTLVANVHQALTARCLIPETDEPPMWIRGRGPWPAEEMLSARNGLLHLPSYVKQEKCFLEPTPRFYTRTSLNYEIDFDAPKPERWLAFLKTLWPNDPESIRILQKWMGYLLLPDTSQQKIMFLVGPRRSGKGTIARVIAQVIGNDNMVAPTLGTLATQFGLWPLLDKSLAIIGDARLGNRTDLAAVTERLLSISGEDPQTVDRKCLTSVTCRLPVRFMILTNELPRLNDPSGALVGRLIVLRMEESFYGREDVGLLDRLLEEIPGILLWSIMGWRRLQEEGSFGQPASSSEIIQELEEYASPVGAFVAECCERAQNNHVAVAELYSAWQKWCEANGRDFTGTRQSFARDLRAVVPELKILQYRVGGVRERAYRGIALKQDRHSMNTAS